MRRDDVEKMKKQKISAEHTRGTRARLDCPCGTTEGRMPRKHAARKSREQYVDAVEIFGGPPPRRRKVRLQGRARRAHGSVGGLSLRERYDMGF